MSWGVLGGLLGPAWAPRRKNMRKQWFLGTLLDPPGTSFGPFGALLGPFGSSLGLSWGPFGTSWLSFCLSWALTMLFGASGSHF